MIMLYNEKRKRKGKPAARHSRKLLIVCLVVAAFLAGMKVVYEAARQYNALLTLRASATELMTIPGGTFTMGTTLAEAQQAVEDCVKRDRWDCTGLYSEDATPPVEVTVDTFRMEKTEVTFGQYVVFLNYLRSQGKDHLTGCHGFACIQTSNDDSSNGVISYINDTYAAPPNSVHHPVFAVTWYGAAAYCEAKDRRLPTEAEWERAARGNDDRLYPWGDIFEPNYAKIFIPGIRQPSTIDVGSHPEGASPYGVLNMAGNVEEWVADWYASDTFAILAQSPTPVINPKGPIVGLEKVLRGGSWDNLPFFARAVQRRSHDPLLGVDVPLPLNMGFRCASDA
jgi:formylglycine-generating enzyme required for sulfatase activity